MAKAMGIAVRGLGAQAADRLSCVRREGGDVRFGSKQSERRSRALETVAATRLGRRVGRRLRRGRRLSWEAPEEQVEPELVY